MSEPPADVAVIGGGLVGLACARELALRGLRVVLLERANYAGGASAASAGLLQPYAEVPEPGAYLDACREALELWPGWLESVRRESGMAVELSDWGTLHVARGDEDSRGWVARLDAALTDLAEPFDRLAPDEVRLRVPQIGEGVEGAVHLRQERRVHNRDVGPAAAEACRRAGVEILESNPVERVELGERSARLESPRWQGRAERVVLAAGAWSGTIPGLPPFPVRPRRGQLVLYEGCTWLWTGCLRAGRRYVVRRGGQELLVGSTVEDVGFDVSTTPEAVASLRAFAEDLLPELRGREPAGASAGLRAGSADDRPLIGRWHDGPLWLATGHFRSGILLAPWTARRLAGWMVDGIADGDNPFSPERFSS